MIPPDPGSGKPRQPHASRAVWIALLTLAILTVPAVPAYINVQDPWALDTTLQDPAPEMGDDFGATVALDGDTMVVGHPSEDREDIQYGVDVGAITVYERVEGEWTAQTTFYGSEPSSMFGSVVALDGQRFVTNAPGDSAWNGEEAVCQHATGELYIFEIVDGTWQQTDVLHPPSIEPHHSCLGGTDRGSPALALEDNLLAAGANKNEGKVFLYEQGPTGWGLNHTFSHPGDPRSGTVDISTDPDRVAIGSRHVIDGKVNWSAQSNGTWVALQVFDRTDEGWTQTATLNSTDRLAAYRLDLSEDGSTVATAASPWWRYVPVHVWKETDGGWSSASKLWPQDGFGHLVLISDLSLQGDTLAVGAWQDDVTPALAPERDRDPAGFWCGVMGMGPENLATPCAAGAAYIFQRSNGMWERTAKIAQETDAGFDAFGWTVALDENTLAVGTPGENGPSLEEDGQVDTAPKGAVYVYEDTDLLGKAQYLPGRVQR